MRRRYQSGGGSGRYLTFCFLLLSIWTLTGATPRRVLLIHSFGCDYAPFDAFTRMFRNDLADQMGEALAFYDVNLESALIAGEGSELPFTTYLSRLFANQPPDLLVPIGGPATQFAQKQRAQLFPDTPMLIAATDERHVQTALFASNDTAFCWRSEPAMVIDGILQILPATTNIAVVIGDSSLERFWLEELRRDFQRFTSRVGFTYYNHLSFAQIQREVSHLPPNSAIFFGLLYVDAEGVPLAGQHVLATLHSLANAPIFGWHETQLGSGVVGGRMVPITKLAATTAGAAVRLLRGEPPGAIKVPTEPPSKPVYDGRELKRWNISETRLPPGSIVRFRERTFWELYWGQVLLGVGLLCAALVGLNLQHAAQLRAAEKQQAGFTRQLLVSQEEERRRIAGELHDGLGQILVLMKNQLGLLGRKLGENPAETLRSIERLTGSASQALGEVRAISQALRPAALEQVGITSAIEWMARQASESSTANFSIEVENVDGLLAPGLEINLYRIAQEGLNNALRHAQASNISFEVKRSPDELFMSLFDNGVGFDREARRNGDNGRHNEPSLGLISMSERAKLLGGKLEIQSVPGTGTRLTVTIPLERSRNGRQEDQTIAKTTAT